MPFLSAGKDGQIFLSIFVQPRASCTCFTGIHDNRLKLAITAPPVDGKANAAVLSFLASFLGVKKKNLEIRHGIHSRKKTVLIVGEEGSDVRGKLLSVLPSAPNASE